MKCYKTLLIWFAMAATLMCSCQSQQTPVNAEQDSVETKLGWFQSLVSSYGFNREDWPKTSADLESYASERKRPLDLSIFKKLAFQKHKDGSLHIRYTFAPPKNESGEWVVRGQLFQGNSLDVKTSPDPNGGIHVEPQGDLKKIPTKLGND